MSMKFLWTARFFCIWLLVVFVCGCATTSKAYTEIQTSVCQIAAHGLKRDGNILRLRAVYISDIVERTMLKDVDCPNEWLGLAVGDNGVDDKSVAELEDAVLGDVINDTELRQFVVDISALYRSKGTNGQGLLYITKVWSFKRIHGDWRSASMNE